MRIRFSVGLALAAALGLGWLACSDGDESVGPGDDIEPEIEILSPTEGATVGDSPAFVIQVDDAGGVLCESARGTMQGQPYDQFFRNGCDPATGRISINGGLIVPPLNDGQATLAFRISDESGNEASASRPFFVSTAAPGPPPAPPSVVPLPAGAGRR